jgi:hypothetical protein
MAYQRRLQKRRRALVPATNGPDNVATPYALARLIVEYYKPRGRVLDPCRGEAQPFYKALLRQPRCIVDWCEIAEGRDFLRYDQHVDWIITNPPWSKIFTFVKHAMTISDNIVFLCSLQSLTLRARMTAMRDARFGLKEALLLPHPPKPWPASGFQLVAMHVRRGYTGPLALTQP